MFNITEADVVGQTNKLLFNIWQELRKEPVPAEQVQPNLDGLKRNELMALVKALPQKPDRWSRLNNAELINLLKEGG